MTTTLTYDSNSKMLTIHGADVVPNELFESYSDIEILDMSGGSLTTLPKEFSGLRNLKILFLSHNDFEEIPSVLANCPQLFMLGMRSCKITHLEPASLPVALKVLILTDNVIESISPNINRLQELQKLTIPGNRLASIPNELSQCQKLELTRFGANKFTEVPEGLLRLPRLAWHSDPGITGGDTHNSTYAWSDITLLGKIGENSKNSIYEANVKGYKQKVALKLYGSNLTADGYTSDEIDISLSITSHDNIIRCLGAVKDNPDQKQGMIMSLISRDYHNLGKPPDFYTLTRDTYANGTQFTLQFVLTVLVGVASALASLHGQNIMHGDLYAHNILVNDAGSPYLSDFGAATRYAPTPDKLHERVEVRAFGHLADELSSRCTPDDEDKVLKLSSIVQLCLDDIVAERPLFTEIQTLLSQDLTL